MSKFQSNRILTLGQQVLLMAQTHPQFKRDWCRNRVLWTGIASVIDGGSTYEISIGYKLHTRPVVKVLRPALQTANGSKIPHTFDDGSICLHLHDEWCGSMAIATTIVPWASLWLYYYEVWLATEKWLGGGV